MFEISARPGHADRWAPAASGAIPDWDRVLEGYASAVDWPASHFWQELAGAYPDAKVVLTVRDPHQWYASFRHMVTQSRRASLGVETLPEAARPVMEAMRRIKPLLDRMHLETFGAAGSGEDFPDEEQAVAGFQRHVAKVKESLPAERLLVFDVREGWGPLCDFLGVKVPDEPFPSPQRPEIPGAGSHGCDEHWPAPGSLTSRDGS